MGLVRPTRAFEVRQAGALVVGLLGLAALVVLNVLQGAVDLSPMAVWRVFVAPTGATQDLLLESGIAAPPAATRRTASTNSPGSAIRSLSR